MSEREIRTGGDDEQVMAEVDRMIRAGEKKDATLQRAEKIGRFLGSWVFVPAFLLLLFVVGVASAHELARLAVWVWGWS